ncbi:hypothetical protein CPB85DRAFT_1301982 [Mucidula mucida]|nr:hypothetical protein CPB85DRAFT_1301982 [Mucidula mucida]
MVLTKNLKSPPTMASRTNSTQPLPKKKSSSGLPPSTTSKKSAKGRSPSTKKSRSLADIVLLFSLFFFSLYAIRVCPSDPFLEDPICKSLGFYRETVIEPYVMPTIRRVREHPTSKRIEEIAVPAYHQIVVPAYKRVVVPAYRTVVVPAYEKAILPSYKRIIRPVYEKKVVPLYSRTVAPYTRRASLYLAQAQNATRPYVRRAELYYAAALPHIQSTYTRLQSAYVAAKPYAHKAYLTARPYTQAAWDQSVIIAAKAAKIFADARKTYVDPHVLKMWAKVMEGGSATRTEEPEPSPIPEDVTDTTEGNVSSTTEAISIAETSASTVSETSSDAAQTTVATVEEVTPVAAETPDPIEESAPSASAPEPTPEDDPLEAVPEATTDETPAPPSFISDELAEELAISAEAARASSSSSSVAEPISTGFISDELAEELSVSAEAARASATSVPSPVPEDTPENEDGIDAFLLSLAEATDERIAKKRANLKERHEKHTQAIKDIADDLFPKLRMSLMQIRSRAAAVMFGQAREEKEWDFVYTADGKKMHIAKEAGPDGVKAECDGLVGGLQGYLEREALAIKKLTLSGEERENELEAKKERFETVLGRVEEKWRSITNDAQARVVQWVRGVREEEFKECLSASGQVKARAERAQADLGLDYAWLEDVTYYDWQDYHMLMGLYEDFRDQVKALQENTHPRPVGDPLNMALPRLEEDMQGEVGECHRQIRVLKKKADNLFSEKNVPFDEGKKWERRVTRIGKEFEEEDKLDGLLNEKEQEQEADADAFIGRGKEEVESVLADIPLETEEETVSILPVEDDEQASILPVEPVPTPEVVVDSQPFVEALTREERLREEL